MSSLWQFKTHSTSFGSQTFSSVSNDKGLRIQESRVYLFDLVGGPTVSEPVLAFMHSTVQRKTGAVSAMTLS